MLTPYGAITRHRNAKRTQMVAGWLRLELGTGPDDGLTNRLVRDPENLGDPRMAQA